MLAVEWPLRTHHDDTLELVWANEAILISVKEFERLAQSFSLQAFQ